MLFQLKIPGQFIQFGMKSIESNLKTGCLSKTYLLNFFCNCTGYLKLPEPYNQSQDTQLAIPKEWKILLKYSLLVLGLVDSQNWPNLILDISYPILELYFTQGSELVVISSYLDQHHHGILQEDFCTPGSTGYVPSRGVQ